MQGVNKERLIGYNRMSVNWLVDFIDVTKYKVKISAYYMKIFLHKYLIYHMYKPIPIEEKFKKT